MQLDFYRRTDSYNHVFDATESTLLFSLVGTPKDVFDIVNPVFEIARNTDYEKVFVDKVSNNVDTDDVKNDNSVYTIGNDEIHYYDLLKADYLYCEQTKRYYFITGVKLISDFLFEVSCREDALSTFFKGYKSASKGKLERTSDVKYVTPYIVDEEKNCWYSSNIIIEPASTYQASGFSSEKYDIDLGASNSGEVSFIVSAVVSKGGSNPIYKQPGPTTWKGFLYGKNMAPQTWDEAEYGNDSDNEIVFEANRELIDSLLTSSESSNVSGSIRKMGIMLIDAFKLPFFTKSIGKKDIYLIGLDTPITIGEDTSVVSQAGVKFSPLLLAYAFTVPSFMEWTDLPPYGKFEVYLPFVGFYEIDLKKFQGHTIYVYYRLNFEDFTSKCVLHDVTIGYQIAELDAHILIPLPVISTDAQRYQQEIMSQSLGYLVKVIGSAASLVAGIATMNVPAIAGGILGAATSTTNYFSSMAMNHENAQATNDSDNMSAIYNSRQIYFRRTHADTHYEDNPNIFVGKPSNRWVSFSSFDANSNYYRFSNVQLVFTDDGGALPNDTERQLFEQAMRDGFYY